MSTEVSTIETVLTAKTDQHDAALAKSEKKLDSFGSNASDAGIRQWMGKVSASFQSLGSSLTGIGASMVAGFTAPAVLAIKSASDLSESLNKVNVVFGSSAAAVVSFSQTAATSLGLSQKAALDAAGGFGNMFVQLGIGREKAAQMSTSIVGLAADFASFHNADISQVLEAQSAAFRGEYDSLQRFLPLMSAATIEQEAMAMSHKKTTKELTAQDKALAVNALMFKGAGAAVGDFARTSDGLANMMRIVRAQLDNLAADIGKEFLPMVQKGLVVVKDWMTSFTSLDPSIKKAAITILGLGAVLAPVILSLGLATTAIGTLISPVGLVVAAVGGLAVAFATNFGGIRDTVTKWAESAKQYYLDHKVELEALGVKVKEIFGNYVQELAKSASELVATLDRMKSAIDSFSTSNDGTWKAILFAVQYVVSSVNAQLKGLIFSFSSTVTAIKGTWAFIEDIIIKPIKAALDWIKAHAGAFEVAFAAITAAAKIGLQVKSPPLAAKWVMMIGDAAEESAKKVKSSSKDYQAGFEAITSATGLSAEALRRLLNISPEFVKQLYAQKKAAEEIATNLEVYGNLIQTAEGRNTDFARSVNVAIGQLLLANNELRSTIIPTMADFGAKIVETTIVTKEMGEAIAKSIGSALEPMAGSLERLIEKMQSSKKASAEWGKVMSEALNRLRGDIVSLFGDGLGGLIVDLAAAFKFSLTGVKEWATDIQKIVAVLPEGFQKAVDKVLQTVNKWVEFGNGVLGVLKKLGFDVPATMGDLIQGMIKNLDFSGILAKVKSFGSSFLSSLKNIFSSAAGMIAGGLGAFAASFGVGGAAGKLLGAGGGALAGAKIGSLIAPGIGTAIGAIGGAIFGGLFGGKKSKEQKAAEEAAKQKASLDMQKAAADIMSAQMEGLKKGLELLEGLKTFSEVPRKAITRFFNEIERILELFAEMAKKFKADSIEASKTVAEVMTGAFESLISGANLIQAIKQVGTVTEQNIADFIDTTFKIFQKWSDAADKIEISTAKFTGKISDKLRTSFEFLNIVPDLLKGITENKGFDASLIDPLFDSVSKIVQKMKALSEAERGMELNRTGATATILATIFDTTKSIVEALSLFANYKPLGEGAFSPINGDIVKVTDWMGSLVSTTASWGSLADAALSNVNRWADGLGKIASSIKLAIGGASSTSGITANITSQSGALYARSGGGQSSTTNTRSDTYNFYFNFDGSLVSEGEYLAKARSEFTKALKERDDRLRLASVS